VSNSLLFSQSYVSLMRLKLASLMTVADTSLEANMPEIQRQFNQLHSEVKTGHETVCEKVDGLANKIDDSLESRPTRAELVEDYAAMAIRMAGVSGAGMGTTTATTTTTTTTTRTTEEDGDYRKATAHLIQIRDVDCVDDIYNEFKGMGPFTGSPIDGGLEACDTRWKSTWRRHFNQADQKRFSRMAQLVKAIDKEVGEGVLLADVLGRFDTYYRQNKRSFCALILQLQSEGFIERKAPRAKRAVARRESPGEGGGGG
jgi:hypothetical protein